MKWQPLPDPLCEGGRLDDGLVVGVVEPHLGAERHLTLKGRQVREVAVVLEQLLKSNSNSMRWNS